MKERNRWLGDILKSALVLLGATGIGWVFDLLGFTEANIIAVYILGVLVISVIAASRLSGMLASVISVLIFNFFFTAPRISFRFDNPDYFVTFSIMLMVTLLSGSLAIRLKENARQSAQAAYRTEILLETNQLLQREKDERSVAAAAAGQLGKLLQKDLVVYLPENGELAAPSVYRATLSANTDLISEEEKAVADWVWHRGWRAGATTDTFSDAKCLYLMIRGDQQGYGVMGIAMNGGTLDPFENNILLSILGECALALENFKNAYPEAFDKNVHTPPMGYFGDPETDIGRACVSLAHPDFKYMTGETLTLEGGLGLRP